MRELDKIRRVISKQIDGACMRCCWCSTPPPDKTPSPRRRQFKKTIDCTGIILAKLDGTAKGGTIFTIKQKLALPVKFIGVGEKVEDLEPFDPDTYVEALFA